MLDPHRIPTFHHINAPPMRVWVFSRKHGKCETKCHGSECQLVCEYGGTKWTARRWVKEKTVCESKGSGHYWIRYCRRGDSKPWVAEHHEGDCKQSCKGADCVNTCTYKNHKCVVMVIRIHSGCSPHTHTHNTRTVCSLLISVAH